LRCKRECTPAAARAEIRDEKWKRKPEFISISAARAGYEIRATNRHVLESGGKIVQETRLWNVAAGRTEAMRLEGVLRTTTAIFRIPILLPLSVPEKLIEEIRAEMAELRMAKRDRFLPGVWKLRPYDSASFEPRRRAPGGFIFEAAVRRALPGKAGGKLGFRPNYWHRLKRSRKEKIESCPVHGGRWRSCCER